MITSKLFIRQKEIKRRIIELSYDSKLAHLGSCLTASDIIDAIYQSKRKEERFVLSCGHAAIALYAVLEKHGLIKPSVIHGLHVHPDRNADLKIDVSSGSLGQGLPIAIGMALADKSKRVYCVITDGECAEGSIWESLRVVYEHNIKNLVLIINANGWGAYDPICLPALLKRIKGFGYRAIVVDGQDTKKLLSVIKVSVTKFPSVIFAKTRVEQFPFLKGQDAHYYVMNEHDYESAIRMLK